MIHKRASRDPSNWTTQDASELYNVGGWSSGYFRIADNGHLDVTPKGTKGDSIDLYELVQDLQRRGHCLPLLIRFSDILASRVKALTNCFNKAIQDYGYEGDYRAIYPIKVNQQRHIIEELVRCGEPYNLGLEVGSKPELLAGLALLDSPQAMLIANGYKDIDYMETALLAQKLGRYPIIVIDRFNELDRLLEVAQRLGVRPHIGVRTKLYTKGAGKWADSTGERSKFGLTAAEMILLVDKLRDVGLLDCLELLHFHVGSQITAVRAIKDAMKEASRIYVELVRMGAGLKFLDVGGGLGVDYDGSSSNANSSMNYSMQEYANDVIDGIHEPCTASGVAHPTVLSESGRALVAHHSVLVFNVLSVDRLTADGIPLTENEVENQPQVIKNLAEAWRTVSQENFQEVYNDVLQLKEEAATQFTMGLLDLKQRAQAEKLFWGSCDAILKIVRNLEYVPEELENLQESMADTYYGNFSVFQSVPDHWAVKQLFPTMPIHRLDERPTRRGIIADLTCDSDGKVDRFINLRDVRNSLELHELKDTPYVLGMFLVGAYQEILGDLHNLFGDTNAVHVSLDENTYRVDHIVEGDSVTEVLGYVQFHRHDLIERMRKATEATLRNGYLTLEESALLMSRYMRALDGYTYLEAKSDVDGTATWDNAAVHRGLGDGSMAAKNE